MRVLVIEPGPSYSVDDVRRGIVSGLQTAGVTVASYNLGDRVDFYSNAKLATAKGRYKHAFDYESACALGSQGIKAACWDMLPDVVIVVSSFFVPPELFENLRARNRHVVLWLTECPYEDTRHVPMAWYADTVIVNDPTNLGTFRQLNPRTYYVPHAYNPKIHHADGRTDTHDFAFVGTGFPSRIEFFQQVDWPTKPVFAGNWKGLEPDSPMRDWLLGDVSLDNTETANLYRASITSANMYRRETMVDSTADGWAMGPREVELAACGTWFARNPRGEGDELFPMLPTFTEPGELAEQIRWALTHPERRLAAATQARAAIADRTFDRHIADVLKLINNT